LPLQPHQEHPVPKKTISNTSDRTMFVGGVMIAPGESRDVDAAYLPPEHQDDAPPAAEPDSGQPDPDANLRELLKGTVKDLTAQLDDFSDETLKRLAELEAETDTPRSTLLGAITDLQLKRAAVKTGAPT
jgi:hypothetical protein